MMIYKEKLRSLKRCWMTIYKHYKKGGNYIILNAGEMQVDDVWSECVIYRCLNSKKIYVREAVDFDLKFSAEIK